jgi:hypothetical protein
MFKPGMTRSACLALFLFFFLLPFSLTHAQQVTNLRTSRPITDDFPQITVYLAVTDGAGGHVSGLSAANFSVLENETLLLGHTVIEEQVGTRQVFLINTTADMKVRDSLGRSRFDLARQALLSWWQTPAASLVGIDDLRLITAEGILITHTRSAADLAATLNEFSPSFDESISGYDILLRALDVTLEAPSHPGMPTHIIFLTPLMRIPQEVAISNIITRARMSGVVIHPVLFGHAENMEQPEAEPLRQLAEATGGQFILFDPKQGLNDLGEKILEQRSEYKLTYPSKVIASGSHLLQIRYSDADLEVLSEIQSFDVTVMPPDVAFIQPPDRITRETEEANIIPEDMPPTSQTLQLLITFPDEHPRALTRSQLIVDGEIVAERHQEPFDSLEWNIRNYLDSQSHTIQAIVEDNLGLQGVSIELPIFIEVNSPPRGLSSLRSAMGPVIAAVAVLILGITISAVIISGKRIPATAPAEAKENTATFRQRLKRAGYRKELTPQQAEAQLVLLDQDNTEVGAIPLSGTDFILGRDPSMTPAPLLEPSVSNLHARIIRQAGGNYLLRDQGSEAGTWVNFNEITEEGRILSHGDLIHIGRVKMRFLQSKPPSPATIRIYPAESDSHDSTHSQERPT